MAYTSERLVLVKIDASPSMLYNNLTASQQAIVGRALLARWRGAAQRCR